jgi:hypothetical protein
VLIAPRIYIQKYVKIGRNGRTYYFKGIKLRHLITKDQHALSTGCAKMVYDQHVVAELVA